MAQRSSARAAWCVIGVAALALTGCADLRIDVPSLLAPRLYRSEIFGFIAGFGTTFAAVPDLVAMFRRRSSAGMNPRMAAILCVFQVVWIYYGLLINSRPVIAWNMIAVLINALSVGAYIHFTRREAASRIASASTSDIREALRRPGGPGSATGPRDTVTRR